MRAALLPQRLAPLLRELPPAPSHMAPPSGCAAASRARACACLRSHTSRLRAFAAPGLQRWQKGQDLPFVQPLVCTKAQGLQCPAAWLAEPKLGRDGSRLSPPSTFARRRICSFRAGAVSRRVLRYRASCSSSVASGRSALPTPSTRLLELARHLEVAGHDCTLRSWKKRSREGLRSAFSSMKVFRMMNSSEPGQLQAGDTCSSLLEGDTLVGEVVPMRPTEISSSSLLLEPGEEERHEVLREALRRDCGVGLPFAASSESLLSTSSMTKACLCGTGRMQGAAKIGAGQPGAELGLHTECTGTVKACAKQFCLAKGLCAEAAGPGVDNMGLPTGR